ncbi:bifunctional 3-oxoadipate enol-lactonase/4-carboxymuconolactone decarboxylase PcaDC [Naasia lichenicola]|uniref:Alpha/beta fold hydrolase n=1 Tax=Naasia lichenicola TaxID=2565933 RepID=A0A4S4FN65_9MICO|nr:alpha/beta fold hydrolase [Naasia lichenicola]
MTTPILRGTLTPVAADVSAAPLLVLGPSLGTTSALWETAAAELSTRFRVLRFDLPGHGLSAPAAEPFELTDLADAVVALVDSVGGGRFSYAGVSIGGAIGIELALSPAGRRLDALAIICSNSQLGGPDGWLDRAAAVRAQGTASMVTGSSQRWFAPGFLPRRPDRASQALDGLLTIDDESYAKCCEALARYDRTSRVSEIGTRTAVVTGDVDPVVSIAEGDALAAAIPGSRRYVLADTGHQGHLERPEDIAAIVAELVPSLRTPSDIHAGGMAVRRAVLGDAHVDRATAAATPETRDFQDLITRYAWGDIWTRPGLDRRMRSAVTLSSLVTAGHWHETGLHVEAALRNGLSRAEISEILLQTAIYAGVPAANSAFGVAREVFARLDAADETDQAQEEH